MIHKYTWRSPDGHKENEIGYFCISQRWQCALQDVRSYTGADRLRPPTNQSFT